MTAVKKDPLKKRTHRVAHFFLYVTLGIIAAIALFPALYMLTNSMMSSGEITWRYASAFSNADVAMRYTMIPEMVTLQTYVDAFMLTPDYLMKFWTSLGLTGIIVIGQALVSCIAGYGLAKFQYPGRNLLYWLIIILMLMPTQVTLVTQYIVLDAFGMLGSYLAVILPGIFAPFGIFLMSQVYGSIPNDMIDAAKLDGAGQLQLLFRVIIPYNRAGLASLIILVFIDNWNMVEQPLIFLQDQTKYPLSIFLSQINTSQLNVAFVCGVLAMLPAVLLFLFLKDALIRGIVSASLK